MSKKSLEQEVSAGFQLVAKDFHTGNMLVDAAINKMVDALNKLDLNHDSISDVAEFAPYVLQLFPKLISLWAYVKQDQLIDVVASSPIFTGNNGTVKALMTDIVNAMNKAEALASSKPLSGATTPAVHK